MFQPCYTVTSYILYIIIINYIFKIFVILFKLKTKPILISNTEVYKVPEK